MIRKHWSADWSAFVESVCRDWDAGLSDAEAALRHAGQRVKWTGKVLDLKRYLEATSVAVRMPDAHFQLRSGKTGRADYIALNVSLENAVEWSLIKTGDRIIFETGIAIGSPDDPFNVSGIEWSDLGDNTVYFKVLTRDARLIKVLGTANGDTQPI